MTGGWIFGAIIGLLLVHLVALRYAYENSKQAVGAPIQSDPDEYVTDEGVECPYCGEVNEMGYRYCRRCVTELPVSTSFVDTSMLPRQRQVF